MKKHNRTKKTDIPRKVKEIVWERDKHSCIFCERYVPVDLANAHFIRRSQGGLGIPENIFTACLECHDREDLGKDILEYRDRAEDHLRKCYGEKWNIENLVYKKYEFI